MRNWTMTAALLCSILVACGESEPWHERDNSVKAYMVMQGYVERRLRSPSTADFPLINKVRVERLEEHHYRITGYVDAQNGFGATVRHEYRGMVQQGGDDLWRLVKLDL
ncbi:hypothetical protein [Algiphilus sp.]|uniref:hypothetical protein n=1 Tax=Algiphilus sp. TaxID=1872431 RepID=UPI0025C73C47|nr:hypothetical protein [Algiphilus sp.]MCK5772013.1 hypothetical protein [Algiphilus sp.]